MCSKNTDTLQEDQTEQGGQLTMVSILVKPDQFSHAPTSVLYASLHQHTILILSLVCGV